MNSWIVRFHRDFLAEFEAYEDEVQDGLRTSIILLRRFGPTLKRPHCDTLRGSKHRNMKEVRFSAAGGTWRVAFAFDPKQEAILLVGADKSGGSQDRFYRRLIGKADQRFDDHLAALKREG